MKRLLSMLLVLMMLMGMGTGFALAEGGKTELHFLIVAGNDEMPGWQGIVDAYNQESQDATIVLEQLPGSWPEYIQKLTTLIAAGSAPDIGRMGAGYMPQFVNKGQLADLTDLVSRDLNIDDYYGNAFEEIKIGGRMYGLPVGVYTLLLYYNKDMFDAAGVEYPPMDWENAWTEEQFLEACEKLTNGEGASKNFGFSVNFSPERTVPFMFGRDADFLNEDHTVSQFGSESSKEVYQMMHDMIYVSGVAPTAAQAESMDISQMFMSGRLGMMAEGQWMMPGFNSKTDYRYGAAPIPGGKTANFIDQYVIFEGSKNKELAWDAVKSFVGEKAENVMVDNALGGIPVNKKVAEARFADLFKPLPDDEKQMVLDSIDHSQAMPFTPNWAEVMDAFKVYSDLISLDEMPVNEALDAASQDIQGMLG